MTANVGVISVEPGGFNVVPGASELTIDVRSPTAEGFAWLEPFVRKTLKRIAAEEQLGLELRETHRKRPVALDPALQDALEAAAGEEGATTLRMPSGAGHDAMVLAHHVPAAMLSFPAAAASATRPRSSPRPSSASWAPGCSPAPSGSSWPSRCTSSGSATARPSCSSTGA